MEKSVITIFGGSGFIGRHLAAHLSKKGFTVRAAGRNRPNQAFMQEFGLTDWVEADIRDAASVEEAIAGSDAVINAISLYIEQGEETYEAVHVEGAENLAESAHRVGVKHFIHLSGIGVDPNSSSPFLKARAVGEQRVHEKFKQAVIFRLSAVFGRRDSFIRKLVDVARFMPIVPLFGLGSTRLQPVYVMDIAKAADAVLRSSDCQGNIYELGGPTIYTYRELLVTVFQKLGLRRALIPLPFSVWKLQARALSVLPSPPITLDQVALMEEDNVVAPSANSFADLELNPVALETVIKELGYA